MENYEQLREYFLSTANCNLDENLLNNIKKCYGKIINSSRTYDNISTLEELVRILEKRGILNSRDITPLRHIAQNYIKNSKLNENLLKFENKFCLGDSCIKITLYQLVVFRTVYLGYNNLEKNIFHTTDTQIDIPDYEPHGSQEQVLCDKKSISTFNNPTNKGIQSLIIFHLSGRMGNQWRDFARYLTIKEIEIDQIQKQNQNNLQQSSNQVLELYFMRANPTNWKLPLLEALDKIRRRDLKELVQDLLYDKNI